MKRSRYPFKNFLFWYSSLSRYFFPQPYTSFAF